jgi:hypothetical protein
MSKAVMLRLNIPLSTNIYCVAPSACLVIFIHSSLLEITICRQGRLAYIQIVAGPTHVPDLMDFLEELQMLDTLAGNVFGQHSRPIS